MFFSRRHGKAVAVAWTAFREQPGLSAYTTLHKSASRTGKWPQWSEKALILLREELATDRGRLNNRRGSFATTDHSRLVKIFLWEGNVDAAWTEANTGSCHDGLCFRLAEAREADHPEDAISINATQLSRALQPAQQQAYEAAVNFLRKIRQLKSRIGKEFEFDQFVRCIRVQYKARRNLMKLLDAEGWSKHACMGGLNQGNFLWVSVSL